MFLAFYADNQQWSKYQDQPALYVSCNAHFIRLEYQSAKKTYQQKAKVPANYHQIDLDRGFIVSGLWSWSRHPNFAAEQSFWVLLYAWACWITQTQYNWTAVGAVSYLILFQASTWFTELISAKKYPEYKEYQRRVGKFLPSLFNLSKAKPRQAISVING